MSAIQSKSGTYNFLSNIIIGFVSISSHQSYRSGGDSWSKINTYFTSLVVRKMVCRQQLDFFLFLFLKVVWLIDLFLHWSVVRSQRIFLGVFFFFFWLYWIFIDHICVRLAQVKTNSCTITPYNHFSTVITFIVDWLSVSDYSISTFSANILTHFTPQF